MSDAILSGDLTVYYLDENRRKQIRWTGGTLKSDFQKMIDVYDAAEDLMTLPAQQDDGLIFSAETPGQYTIGKIDAGDVEPWFIDLVTMEYIIGDYQNFTGCALKTAGWKRDLPGDGTGNTGIVVVKASASDIDSTDIGDDITNTTNGDDGTLLDVVDIGSDTYLFIRPDTNNLADDWDSTSGTIDMAGSAHTATQAAAAVTGEMIWGNPYSKGGIQSDTHIYLYQDGGRVTRIGSTTEDWWSDGHMDRALPITDFKTANFPIIDEGYLTVFARKYGSKHSYDSIAMNTTSGGNVTAALGSGDDGNNTTGYASILLGGGSGNWNVGDEISGDTSGARAVITLVSGSNPTPTLHYYYVGDPLTVFNGTEAITNEDDTGAATSSGSPSSQGPALSTWFDNNAAPTIVFANTVADIDDDTVDEPYGITIDVNQALLTEMYEWTKYIQRRGSVFDMDGLDGQEWLGIDYRVNYTGITGTISEGATVTGVTSGATGVVVSHDTTNDVALLRNSRGTFVDAEVIQVDGANKWDAGVTVTVLTPILENSLMTKAGALIIGAVGVLLSDYKTTEENSFTLYDANGVIRERPTSVSMAMSNLKQYDWATCFRLDGAAGSTKKDEYSAAGAEVAGATSLVVDGSITADTVGKSAGGRLYLIDASDNNQEYVIRHSSWAGSTFTLANIDVAAADAATTTTVQETGAFANAQVGDLVYNHDRTGVSYVSEVTDNDNIVINPPITGQTTGDHIELNCVPIALVDTADTVFVAIIHKYMTGDGSTSASMQYLADIFTRVRVRNTSDAATKIKGYVADITIGTGGGAAVATRIPNTVYGS